MILEENGQNNRTGNRPIITLSTINPTLTNVVLNMELSVEKQECSFEFEVLTAVYVKGSLFWDMTPCSLVRSQRFEGSYSHDNQSFILNQ
jgi:hypothetical protein